MVCTNWLKTKKGNRKGEESSLSNSSFLVFSENVKGFYQKFSYGFWVKSVG